MLLAFVAVGLDERVALAMAIIDEARRARVEIAERVPVIRARSGRTSASSP